MKESKNKHEKAESKGMERKEKKMKTEAEYKKGKGGSVKNYKGKCC
jgi:hypothetical protein